MGTTNSTLSFVDTEAGDFPEPQTLPVPQIIAPGEFSAENVLPSFLFIPNQAAVAPGSLKLPWSEENPEFTCGAYARKMAGSVPGRVVSSAKSWLCQKNIDPDSACLPFGSNETSKISPVDTISLFLKHLASSWDKKMAADKPEFALCNQQIILTVPASFDAVARELTVKAAEKAGLDITLLEEPQAAFYSWLREHDDDWRQIVSADSNILVCDIGGGTSDFSLIGVEDYEGSLCLNRLAVGNHILLGGERWHAGGRASPLHVGRHIRSVAFNAHMPGTAARHIAAHANRAGRINHIQYRQASFPNRDVRVVTR